MGKILETRIHATVANYLPNTVFVKKLEKALMLGYIAKIKGSCLLKRERSGIDYSEYITVLKRNYAQKTVKNHYISYNPNREKDLSIIIPTYDTHKYIDQCLKSLKLDYLEDSIEVIIVDDGSDEPFRRVLESWQQRYTSLRVVFQPNRGISAARNHGIEISRGKYLTFLDSDDIIDMDILQLGLSTAMAERLDLISFDYQNFNDDEAQDVVVQPDNGSLLKTVHGYAWGKIYKSSLW
ncbi:glycosyltransferase family 2 protein [Lactiplantibacillus sp. WILCCON 0030]|uniref:Glycosyltransferase family 2 protein n=1 Tax=Lactiplantibacillus brownii TaxID=3069269 RepID=A0ABU1A9W8_9LACO|nr:glycosyltransferase family 2 protein [Lactiplantibacillus brownii]MDQ7937722.1 glycosyltransferase family 2 protein [Lactiplantibacillus brownii]